MAWAVIQPTRRQTQITRHLFGGREQKTRKRVRINKLVGRAQQRHDIHISGCPLPKPHRNQCRSSTDNQTHRLGLGKVKPSRQKRERLIKTCLIDGFSYNTTYCSPITHYM
ncbi:MAG: hypothetical protein NT167_27785 [Verrucomicrobia bacterium]|nr:hypothetical protein [Verrucomicrobiota bacterium]